jgi:hypothetical protein
MMNLKSFLLRNFSRILYFLARKNSGKGSVPHSICNQNSTVTIFSFRFLCENTDLYVDGGLSTLVQRFVSSESTLPWNVAKSIGMVWLYFSPFQWGGGIFLVSQSGYYLPLPAIVPASIGRWRPLYVRISLWVKIGNCRNNRLIYIFLYVLSDCQCKRCNGPGFNPSILRHRSILVACRWNSVE